MSNDRTLTDEDRTAVVCCCHYGSARSGEWPEFECGGCLRHIGCRRGGVLGRSGAGGMTLPEPMIRVPNPVFEAAVERRARQLCAWAEPHEVEERCHVHESEARRQLVDQWQDQIHEESRL